MSRLEEVRERFSSAQKLLGIYENHTETRTQRGLAAFLLANLAFLNFLYLWNIAEESQNLLLRLQLAIQWMCVFSYSIFFVLLIRCKKVYESCLEWCEGLHRESLSAELRDCFERCAQESSQIFKFVLRELAWAVFVLCILQMCLLSYVRGEFSLLLEVYLPLLPRQSLQNKLPCCLHQSVAAATLMLSLLVSVSVIAITIKYCLAVMEAIKIQLQSAQALHETLRDVAVRYCDLMLLLEKLISLAAIPLLAFEVSSYGLLLLIWVIIFQDPPMLMMAAAASGEFVLYLLVCFMNEKLIDAFEDLREAFYDFRWYDLAPLQRRSFLRVVMMASQPKVLTVGPFHVMCYEDFGTMLRRVYKCGVLVNKLVS